MGSTTNSETPVKTLDNNLPQIHRFITSHNSKAEANFDTTIPEPLDWQKLPDGARFSLGYTTSDFPVNMTKSADINSYADYLVNKPGITIPGGTVLRLVDMMPGVTSPMHRTVSLDYGVVLEGSVALVLDSGEERIMRRGDVSVQRGTMHAWRNCSQTEWARMLYVLQEATEVRVSVEGEDGKEKEDVVLGEDYGGIPGVRASGH